MSRPLGLVRLACAALWLAFAATACGASGDNPPPQTAVGSESETPSHDTPSVQEEPSASAAGEGADAAEREARAEDATGEETQETDETHETDETQETDETHETDETQETDDEAATDPAAVTAEDAPLGDDESASADDTDAKPGAAPVDDRLRLSVDWTHQRGSQGSETSYTVDVVGDGDIVLAAATDGTLGGAGFGGRDIYVARIDSTGATVWETQLGTPAADAPLGLSAGPGGVVYVAGYTEGDLAGPSAGSADVWLAKFDADGTLLWQRQFGGPLWDRAFDVDAFDGGVYVSGYTFGDIGDDPAPGGGDAFAARFDDQGERAWLVQFGTDRTDWGQGAAAAPDGSLYVTGFTEGDLAGPNRGERDAFVARLTSDGEVDWTRQFGGPATDWTQWVGVDARGNVYLTGITDGQADAETEHAGERDGLLASYAPEGELRFVTQIGTEGADSLFEVRVHADGIVATGSTTGSFEAADAANEGERDGILVRFDNAGALIDVAVLGTVQVDDLTGLAIAPDGRVVFGGHTSGDLADSSRGGSDLIVGAASIVGP